MLKRLAAPLLVAALALVALTAPAGATPPTTIGLDLELEIFDLHASSVCEADVFANVSGTFERRAHRNESGDVVRVTETFHGQIEWFTRGSGKSYASSIDSVTTATFPEGVDFFTPAKITVVGRNGGPFPIGGGPAGSGRLDYDGFIYTVDDEGVPSFATEGDPIAVVGNFTSTTERICAALA